jgi:hypothetical protein
MPFKVLASEPTPETLVIFCSFRAQSLVAGHTRYGRMFYKIHGRRKNTLLVTQGLDFRHSVSILL